VTAILTRKQNQMRTRSMRNLGEVTDGIHDGSVMGTDIGLAPVDVRFTPEFVAKRGRLRRLGWS
jgi:hypothetical protein